MGSDFTTRCSGRQFDTIISLARRRLRPGRSAASRRHPGSDPLGSAQVTHQVLPQRSTRLRPTLRPDRRHERMDITGLTGMSDVQKMVLKTLGAVERNT